MHNKLFRIKASAKHINAVIVMVKPTVLNVRAMTQIPWVCVTYSFSRPIYSHLLLLEIRPRPFSTHHPSTGWIQPHSGCHGWRTLIFKQWILILWFCKRFGAFRLFCFELYSHELEKSPQIVLVIPSSALSPPTTPNANWLFYPFK